MSRPNSRRRDSAAHAAHVRRTMGSPTSGCQVRPSGSGRGPSIGGQRERMPCADGSQFDLRWHGTVVVRSGDPYHPVGAQRRAHLIVPSRRVATSEFDPTQAGKAVKSHARGFTQRVGAGGGEDDAHRFLDRKHAVDARVHGPIATSATSSSPALSARVDRCCVRAEPPRPVRDRRHSPRLVRQATARRAIPAEHRSVAGAGWRPRDRPSRPRCGHGGREVCGPRQATSCLAGSAGHPRDRGSAVLHRLASPTTASSATTTIGSSRAVGQRRTVRPPRRPRRTREVHESPRVPDSATAECYRGQRGAPMTQRRRRWAPIGGTDGPAQYAGDARSCRGYERHTRGREDGTKGRESNEHNGIGRKVRVGDRRYVGHRTRDGATARRAGRAGSHHRTGPEEGRGRTRSPARHRRRPVCAGRPLRP